MKFTSIPKKLVLTGMSAAMVVAFAPAVAQAAVTDAGDSSAIVTPTESGDTVATLTYTDGSKNYSQDFKSTKDYTNDDALQAALVVAAQLDTNKYQDITVTLAKDVTVANVTGAQDKVNETYAMPSTSNSEYKGGLVLAGKVKLDLGGHTLKNTGAVTTDAEGKEIQEGNESYAYAQPAVTVRRASVSGGVEKKTETVYATKSFTKDNVPTESDQVKTADHEKFDSTGKIITDVKSADNKLYEWNDALGKYVESTTGKRAAYTVTYTVSKQDGTIGTDNGATIENGTVESATTQSAIRVQSSKAVTLGKGLKVVSTKAAAAVDAKDANVKLQEGASVSASLPGYVDNNGNGTYDKDEASGVTAIKAGDVKFGLTAAQAKAKADPRATVAGTVTATLTDGHGTAKNPAEATGIDAATVEADTAANVTATATGAAASTETTPGSTKGTGLIDEDTSTSQAGTATSYAVNTSGKATLRYGTYTGVNAVKANSGEIDYGTYDGYVNGIATVKGGKFKYDSFEKTATAADKSVKDKDGNDLQKEIVLNSDSTSTLQLSFTTKDGWTYVYRIGKVTGSDGKAIDKGTLEVKSQDETKTLLTVSVPKGAKQAGLTNYVQANYLDAETAARVASQDAVGTDLNDGNKTDTLDVKLSAGYVTPTEAAAAKAKQSDAYDALAKQADANVQTPQGIYVLAAEQDYGTETVNGQKVAKKDKDVASLGDAKLDLTAGLVQTNSGARVYKLAKDSAAEVQGVTTSKAVGDTIDGTATWTTAEPGVYGVTVTTNKDSQEQGSRAAAKAVSNAIAAIPALASDGSNYAEVQKAANDAQARYDLLTDAQKALVTNYGDIEAKLSAANDAQKAAEKAKADQAATAKATATAKAKTVKGLKVKAGKGKATVSWKAAKGYKYQVKYRQKNSSKTGDFKYKKTSKAKVTLKGLKKGKYYNFKVRAYKKVAGKTVYGKYTSIVTAKVK